MYEYPNTNYYGAYGQVQPYRQATSMYQQPPPMPVPAQQAAPSAQTSNQGLSAMSRLVTSKEEAMGVAADFSGALMVFPDVSHNRVYIKRWNYQTGAADFIEFNPANDVQNAQATVPIQTPTYVAKEIFDEKIAALETEIERLKKTRNGKKGESDE